MLILVSIRENIAIHNTTFTFFKSKLDHREKDYYHITL